MILISMRDTFERLHAYLGIAARWLCAVAGLVMLLVMALGTGVDVVMRNFGYGIPGIWEAVTLAMRAMIGLALPFAFFSGSHIAVEYFTDRLSPMWRQLAVVVGTLVTFLVVTLLAWKITDRMFAVKGYGGLTSDLSIPVYFEWLALAIGPVLSVPVLLSLFLRELFSFGKHCNHDKAGAA